jgi:hypothetical protein
VSEAMDACPATVVRLIRALTLGHARGRPSDREVGDRRDRRPVRVYGGPSPQDKGLDKRKSVKSTTSTCGVDIRVLASRPPSPRASGTPRRRSRREPSRRGFPLMWKGPVE